MQSRSLIIAEFLAILLCVSTGAGCGEPKSVAPPAANSDSPEQVKKLVTMLNELQVSPGFGINVKAAAADELDHLGQAAIDAGAIPELTKLSNSPKGPPEAKAAAKAALAKLNAAAAQ